MAFVLLLAGCGSMGARAVLTPTVHATVAAKPTPTPDPRVTIQVTAHQQQGSIAEHKLIITFAVTVTNHTDQPISLIGSCEMPAIIIALALQGGPAQPVRLVGAPNCVLGTDRDIPPAIAPAGSHTWTQTLNIFDYSDTWPAGTYVVTASIREWHQGSFDSTTGLYGSPTAETTITLQ